MKPDKKHAKYICTVIPFLCFHVLLGNVVMQLKTECFPNRNLSRDLLCIAEMGSGVAYGIKCTCNSECNSKVNNYKYVIYYL